jgi:predicted transcriptional regulator
VRTTISLSDDLHAQLVSAARDRHQSLSRTIEELVRRALGGDRPAYSFIRDHETGFVGVDFGRPITDEDVRSLDDDE